MASSNYDLIVVGSGPAGEKGAAQAAYFGRRVALVEKAPALGGAAANTGTLPSKTLRETALFLSGFHQRELYGVTLSLRKGVTARDFLAHERRVRKAEQNRVTANLQRHKVNLFCGAASFEDPHTLRVSREGAAPQRIRGDVVLIATGSRPYRPSLFPFEDPRVFDSDTILSLSEIPEDLLVVGGGVIGCEYACLFAALGVRVTLTEGRQRLLPFLDSDVGALLESSMRGMGITLVHNTTVTSVTPRERVLDVELSSSTAGIQASAILVAAGRQGNSEQLNLAAAGLTATPRGTLPVNEHYQTAVPHIYAAGDVIGFPALASTSMEQARVAMVHAFDLKYKTGLAAVLPYGIYTIPECSMAGETEESLRAGGVPYFAGVAQYSANARGQIIGAKQGFLKLLFAADSMKLLGVHIIGEQASEIVHIGLAALQAGSGADQFIQACYNYPTLGELYKYAAYDALGRRARS